MATFNKTTDPSECNYSLLFCVVIVIVTYKLWVVVFQTLCRRENCQTLTGGRIKAEIVALAQVDQMKRKWVTMTQLLLWSYQVAEISEDELKDMLVLGTFHVV